MQILVAIDFSDITKKVIEHARIMASALSSRVTLIHVAEPNPDQSLYDLDPSSIPIVDPAQIRDQIAQRFHQEHQQLQQYAETMRDQGIECKALMIQGPVVELLLQQAQKMEADFFIIGSHGKGILSQVLLGSCSEDLLKQTELPVFLVPADKSA